MIELSELRDAAQKAFPADVLRPERDVSWRLIADMGWLMMAVPENIGGLGLGREAAVAIHFELGRVLSRAPLAAALLGLGTVVGAGGFAGRGTWAEQLMAGEFVTASLIGDEARLADGQLSGRLTAFADADMAGHALVFAAGLAALVPLDATGVTLTERPLWDETRRLFDLTLEGVGVDRALVLAEGAEARALAQTARDELRLALAADALGGANAALERSVEYLRTRKQFDRPLAMFQALKHRVADLKTRIAAAEALLWAKASEPAATSTDIGALKALACEVYRFVTEEAVQLHGGIGLTEEHDCHLFLKRAQLDLWLAGGADALNEASGRAALAAFAG